MSHIRQDKWCKFLTNFLLWVSILILILTIFLLFLSTSYLIAQLLEAKLDLITECPEPIKTREEIWRHSYESSLKYPSNEILNYETQYGLTDEPCWTKKVEINTNQLWYSNKYNYQWKNNVNAKSILFGIISIYCFYNHV